MPGQAQHGIRALPWAVCRLGMQGCKCWGEGRGLTGGWGGTAYLGSGFSAQIRATGQASEGWGPGRVRPHRVWGNPGAPSRRGFQVGQRKKKGDGGSERRRERKGPGRSRSSELSLARFLQGPRVEPRDTFSVSPGPAQSQSRSG